MRRTPKYLALPAVTAVLVLLSASPASAGWLSVDVATHRACFYSAESGQYSTQWDAASRLTARYGYYRQPNAWTWAFDEPTYCRRQTHQRSGDESLAVTLSHYARRTTVPGWGERYQYTVRVTGTNASPRVRYYNVDGRWCWSGTCPFAPGTL